MKETAMRLRSAATSGSAIEISNRATLSSKLDASSSQTPRGDAGRPRAAVRPVRHLIDVFANGLFIGIIFLLLYVGWINRDERVWIPDHGLGYALGIVGGSMMLLLLLYPFQKRLSILGKWLKIRHFFRLHMVFGILGPVLILLHSNFHLGSINGQVALFSMLIVMFSGLVGRYIYTKIHHGLYGRRATFEDYRLGSREISNELEHLISIHTDVKQQLVRLEEKVEVTPDDFFASLVFWTRTRLSAAVAYRSLQRQLMGALKAAAAKEDWARPLLTSRRREARYLLKTHKFATTRMLEIRFHERMFSLWHVLHLPLFLMMVLTGFAHVYAVHVF